MKLLFLIIIMGKLRKRYSVQTREPLKFNLDIYWESFVSNKNQWRPEPTIKNGALLKSHISKKI